MRRTGSTSAAVAVLVAAALVLGCGSDRSAVRPDRPAAAAAVAPVRVEAPAENPAAKAIQALREQVAVMNFDFFQLSDTGLERDVAVVPGGNDLIFSCYSRIKRLTDDQDDYPTVTLIEDKEGSLEGPAVCAAKGVLAFRWEGADPGTSGLVLTDLNGKGPRLIDPNGSRPDFHPECCRMLYIDVAAGNSLVMTDLLKGTKSVIRDDLFVTGARFSPDGSAIVYSAQTLEDAPEESVIYRRDLADGSDREVWYNAAMPAVSPDGRYIAFLRTDFWFLYVYDTRLDVDFQITSYPCHSAAWSNDGRSLYVVPKAIERGLLKLNMSRFIDLLRDR